MSYSKTTGSIVFDKFSQEYHFWAHTCREARYKNILEFVPFSVNNALDAGCGSGVLANELCKKVYNVVGVDISKNMLQIGKNLIRNPHIHFLQANLNSLPVKEKSFDFIASYGVLHHLNIGATLDYFRKILLPSGRIIIIDFTTTSLYHHRSRSWQIKQAIKALPVYFIKYGVSKSIRVLRFRMSKKWLDHICKDNLLTKDELRDTYSYYLSNPTINFKGGFATVYWQGG